MRALLIVLVALFFGSVITATYLVLSPKPKFILPVAWCYDEDISLSAPCKDSGRQIDI